MAYHTYDKPLHLSSNLPHPWSVFYLEDQTFHFIRPLLLHLKHVFQNKKTWREKEIMQSAEVL